MAHPAVLSRLVSEYEALSRLVVRSPETMRRMDDLAYTLCVSTGTRDVDTALAAARQRLYGARPENQSRLAV
ncbi:DUF5133 domain-containing protein [Streptomyces sp. NPDC005963]|uniref:DUF5133 domain-containing protein n=1 Tax=Streptomyces sp. NPDC005963 TaxID=3156721 RepID=UPI0033E08D9A